MSRLREFKALAKRALGRLREMRAAGVLIAFILLLLWDTYGLDPIPFGQIFGDTPWAGISYHVLSALGSIFFIWVFCPQALRRITHRPTRKHALVGAGVVVVIACQFFSEVAIPGFSIWMVTKAILFCLSIGLGEEFFSRGLIYGLFERFDWRWAIGISSLEFGLSHFTNMIGGGQDFAQTSAQVLSACAFGFLAAALMLYTGNIWFGIVMHGLSDYSLVSTPHDVYVKNLTAAVDWVGLGVLILTYLAIGSIPLYLHLTSERQSLERQLSSESDDGDELEPTDFALTRIRSLTPDSSDLAYLLEIAWLYDRIVQAGSTEPVIDLSYELVLPLDFVAECVRRAMDARLIKLPVRRSNGGRISQRALKKLKLIE